MRVVDGTKSFRKDPKKPLVLALGNFDGVHRGHARLLDYVVNQARHMRGRAAVFTFREHPQNVLHPGHVPANLQSLEQRLALFREHGIDICFLQRFDKKFSSNSARDFIVKILVKKLDVAEICLGYNARFGRGREGDADLLRDLGRRYHFEVCQMEPVTVRGMPVSSTAVREAVHLGDMELAARFLGRPWSFTGKVVRGDGRGGKLGFPTANLKPGYFIRPAPGVYAIKARINGRKSTVAGVLNFGNRPTFGKKEPVYEAHLFDFHGKLYGKNMEIFFLKRLRSEKGFASAAQLKKQIQKDIQSAKKIFKGTNAD